MSTGAESEHPAGDPGASAGVGYSQNTSSRQAGEEAARAALERAGVDTCDLVLLFTTSKHDPAALREGVRSVVGPEPRLAGGYAAGVITNDRLGYEGFQVGVAVLRSERMKVDMFLEKGLPDNEGAVGRALGRAVAAGRYDDEPNLLLLYDIVKQKQNVGMSLNMATPLIGGMEEALGGAWPRTAGGGMTGDMQWNPTHQFFDDRIEEQSAIALILHGGVRMDTTIMHGCRPSSAYFTITRADGNVVLELDGRPTADVVAELMGQGPEEIAWEEYPLYVTLGINNGDKFDDYREDDYSVRLCMDVDRERRGLVFFGDDLVPGTEVQLMRRSINFDYIQERTRHLLEGAGPGRRPFLALYIDCAGRAATYAGTDHDEAAEVQQAIGDEVPLLGWYVGCEIARSGDRMQSHNWTGILCLLSEPA